MKKTKFKVFLCTMMALIMSMQTVAMVWALPQTEEDVTVTVLDEWTAEGENLYGNNNVTEENGISVYRLDPPSSYLSLLDGPVSFRGTADGSTLYMNNGFYGKSTVWVSVTNYKTDRPLIMTLYKSNEVAVTSIEIPKNGGRSTSISGLSSTTNYYFSFKAPSDFAGNVH